MAAEVRHHRHSLVDQHNTADQSYMIKSNMGEIQKALKDTSNANIDSAIAAVHVIGNLFRALKQKISDGKAMYSDVRKATYLDVDNPSENSEHEKVRLFFVRIDIINQLVAKLQSFTEPKTIAAFEAITYDYTLFLSILKDIPEDHLDNIVDPAVHRNAMIEVEEMKLQKAQEDAQKAEQALTLAQEKIQQARAAIDELQS